ncbi:hypothetical protein DFH08DRAFT_938734 [Mycena albidolilacea]|uniref:Uncharacterized protein n=1 Tax=Mycena albidolilacea TaxID=1033008 RepID=A0AAD6ZUA8_9AGAR|nr:hypothetical protein DFH08DRAFT_938734 [Mycena albidolilacea]
MTGIATVSSEGRMSARAYYVECQRVPDRQRDAVLSARKGNAYATLKTRQWVSSSWRKYAEPCSGFQFATLWKEIAKDGQRCMTVALQSATVSSRGRMLTPADRKYMRYFERRQWFPQVGERRQRDVATGLMKAMSSTTSENENWWRVGKGAVVDDEGTECERKGKDPRRGGEGA